MLRTVMESIVLLSPRDRFLYLILAFARAGVNGLDLLGLIAVGFLGTYLASGSSGLRDLEFLGFSIQVESESFFLVITGSIAAFFTLKSVIGSILMFWTTRFLADVESRATVRIINFLFSGDISRMSSLPKGEVQWVANTSSYLAFSSMLFAGIAVLTETTLLVGILVTFFFVDPILAAAVTGFLAFIVAVFQGLVGAKIRRLGERLRSRSVEMNTTILDLVSVFRESLAMNRIGFFLERFATARKDFSSDRGNQRFYLGVPRYFIESALMIGIFFLIGFQHFRGDLEEGLVAIGVFLAGATRMMAAVLPLQNAVTDLRVNSPQARKAQELYRDARKQDFVGPSMLSGHIESPQANRRVFAPPALSAEGVSHSYAGSRKLVLDDVSFTVPRGTFSAVIGPSGSGKSTLFDTVLGLLEPVRGVVLIDGLPPSKIRLERPGYVAYVPQSPGLVAGSIAENVALGIPSSQIDSSRVLEVIRIAGLQEWVSSMAEGIDSSLGPNSDALSGGQRQRLGVARALYSRPKVVLLDEATSALDAETEASLSSELHALVGEITLIVIAHRLVTVQNANEILVMEEGKIVARGPLSALREKVPSVARIIELSALE